MDITNDNLKATLLHVCRKGGAPDYVINAKPMDKEAADRLPDGLFADRVNRRYPVDSKASTWLSAAYFAKTAEDDHYSSETMKNFVEANIKLAANKFGIRKDVDEAMARIREKPSVKAAADDESNYGWPSERKYPMFDEHGVKLAQSYFAENCFSYPARMRRTIASNILRKCAEYGMEPSDVVRREAGEGFSLREDAAAELVDRAKAVAGRNVKLANAMSDAVRALMAVPVSRYPAQAEKFAEVLDHVDEEMGFADQYGTRFRSPMEIFHGRSIKEAQSFLDDAVQLGPDVFSLRKLAELPLSLFTDALGDGFGDSVKSVKVIRITKKMPGGMMRMTISGGMPDMMGGGFGFDSMLPRMLALPVDSMGGPCDSVVDVPCEECGEREDEGKGSKDFKEDSEEETEEYIDVKKLGKALKALPERDRNALRKAIEMYAD